MTTIHFIIRSEIYGFPQQMASCHEDKMTSLVDPLQTLPPEIGVRILGLLPASDLCRASAVSRHWYQLTSVDQLRRRRRRYVNYMRHVWATQRQNLLAGVAAGSITSLQSVGSGSTMSRGSSAARSSCSSVNATPDSSVAGDSDDGVFRLPSQLRRPLGERRNVMTHGCVAEAWPPQRTPTASNGERPASDSSLCVVGVPAGIEPPLSVNVPRARRPSRTVDKQAKRRLRRL